MKREWEVFPAWAEHLNRMRGPGKRRADSGNPSDSLLPLLQQLPDGAVVIDLGCGESADTVIARQNGLVAFKVDLFPPSDTNYFIQANAVKLPFTSASVDGFVNHAMLSLIKPSDRWAFYDEVARVLKPDGLLSLTPYNLSDGAPVRLAIEDDKAFQSGLHKLGRGLYQKCNDVNCQHEPDDSFQAIQDAADKQDTDPEFRRIAPLLIAWVTRGGSVSKTVEFTGRPKKELMEVVQGCIDCGIFDPKEGVLDAPWLNHYLDDEIAEGNIALILDVLYIRGLVERIVEDGQAMFKSRENPPSDNIPVKQ